VPAIIIGSNYHVDAAYPGDVTITRLSDLSETQLAADDPKSKQFLRELEHAIDQVCGRYWQAPDEEEEAENTADTSRDHFMSGGIP
jgi:hypothetical protein